jgi:hypothetical protein
MKQKGINMLKVTDLNTTSIRINTVPQTEEQLAAIPTAARADFELKEKEMKQARRFIYAVNRINKMRFITRWDNPILMVWRVK